MKYSSEINDPTMVHALKEYVPPYKSSIATKWSPAFSKCVMAVVAPSPEENSKPIQHKYCVYFIIFFSYI